MTSTAFTRDFPSLSHLSREDLQDLLNDPAYFQAMFHSLPQVKAMYQSQGEFAMANEQIARNNLAFQESLYNLRSETQDAFNEARALEARWKELEREQKEVYQRFTPQFLLMRLKHATTAQDDQSEALASAFVRSTSSSSVAAASAPGVEGTTTGANTPSGKDVEDFVREFKEMRTVYHRRVMFSERWTNGDVVWRDDD